MNNYTPGPWKPRQLGSGYAIVRAAEPDGRRIVRGAGGVDRREDAVLIAAAPQLLEACRALLDADLYDDGARAAAYEQIAEAVGEAEGREWTLALGPIGTTVLFGPEAEDEQAVIERIFGPAPDPAESDE